MNKAFDFERWQPPVLTAASLRREYRRRQKRKVLLALSMVCLLNTLLLFVLFALSCGYSRTVALGILALLCISLICMGITVVVFTVKRRDLIDELY